jgi:hypothetical protein
VGKANNNGKDVLYQIIIMRKTVDVADGDGGLIFVANNNNGKIGGWSRRWRWLSFCGKE